MEMTEDERADLAKRVMTARYERYKGSRLAAYRDADLNSTTWGRVEAGKTVKEATVVAVVQTLWPETRGDWRKLDPPLGSRSDLAAQVRASNLSAAAKTYILDVLTEHQQRRTA